MAAGDGGGGALLADQGQFVHRLAADAFHAGDWRPRLRPGCDCGWRARRRRLPLSMVGGPSSPGERRLGMDIISVPPATMRSSMPDMIEAAAILTVVMPDPQKRSRVTPLERTS